MRKGDKHEAKRITKRSENYSKWYSEVIRAAELAEHSAVKGSMVIKPYGYVLWERIRGILDEKFKSVGVQNAYFPLLIPEKLLNKEAEHVEGFSPEVAAVTYAGGKKLKEAFVIRPTSETIIYATFAKWIESHRDLPVLINQWANVVRWELRPRLFLRTTEFLWQEGHTAHATKKEADERARLMLNIYKDIAENYMAIPVIAGSKSQTEKFAGADFTYTLEAMMQDGKALQFATAHNLGQNFAKAFGLEFTSKSGKPRYCWQTSWGLSTRTIGAMVMVHGDDKGLVVPPRMASISVVIIPVWNKKENKKTVLEVAERLMSRLKDVNKHGVVLDTEEVTFGEKQYKWEKKGVPIRIEIGPRDIAKDSVVMVRRDTGEKVQTPVVSLIERINVMLDSIQDNLYRQALAYREGKTKTVNTWEGFKKRTGENNFVLAHWCGDSKIEAKIKEETGATIRCIPFKGEDSRGKCIYSGKKSNQKVMFAKAY